MVTYLIDENMETRYNLRFAIMNSYGKEDALIDIRIDKELYAKNGAGPFRNMLDDIIQDDIRRERSRSDKI